MTEKVTRRAFAEAGTAAALAYGSLAFAEPASAQTPGRQIKAGLIGLDTSHVPETLLALGRAKPGGPLDGVKVVAAYPGGTQTIRIVGRVSASSPNRLASRAWRSLIRSTCC